MFLKIILDIPPMMQWTTAQVANVISIVTAAATVWALAYALKKGRDNSKKINDLAKIAEYLAKQNELIQDQIALQKLEMKNGVRPNFIAYGPGMSGPETSRQLQFRVKNKGQLAIINNVVYESDHINFTKLSLITIKPDFEVGFTGTVNSNEHPLIDCTWKITIHFLDVHGNKYAFVVDGVGGTINNYPGEQKDEQDHRR